LNYNLIQYKLTTMENRKVLKSGEFLVSEVESKDVFIPEELTKNS